MQIFAVLIHEKPDCVVDLIENLRMLDPKSLIIIYDASAECWVSSKLKIFQWNNVEYCRNTRPMRWGELHEYALSCINHAQSHQHTALTFVDSDQLLIRPNYSDFIEQSIKSNTGILSVQSIRHGVDSNIVAVRDFHSEWQLWLPYLRRFTNYTDAFVRWTFWPGTVIAADAARSIYTEFNNPKLKDILEKSKVWATEECLIPTISYLLGFDEIKNPCSGKWCTFRTPWTEKQILEAFECDAAFFVHPVKRNIDDPIRSLIRSRLLSSKLHK